MATPEPAQLPRSLYTPKRPHSSVSKGVRRSAFSSCKNRTSIENGFEIYKTNTYRLLIVGLMNGAESLRVWKLFLEEMAASFITAWRLLVGLTQHVKNNTCAH
jgi:hypothetical protein